MASRFPAAVLQSPWTGALILVFALWVLVFFDPHILLAVRGLGPLRRLPTVLYAIVGVFVLLQFMNGKREIWYIPFLLFLITAAVTVPFAEHTGFARRNVFKIIMLYYVHAVATLYLVKTPDKTVLLLKLFFFSFVWWVLHADMARGGADGRVAWHPDLGNEDAFGPLMVIGMGYCVYLGMAAKSQALRWTAFITAGLCVFSVVASFARGAVLGAFAVALYMWLRSPKKGRALAFLILGAGIVMLGSVVLFPEGMFWTEIQSAFTEGTETGTGRDRWLLWKMGWEVFKQNPILGVGSGNFGIWAYYNLEDQYLDGFYAIQRGKLWDRTLHNVHMQVLAEHGIIGVITMLALLTHFWRRNRELRSAPFVATWARLRTGLDLRGISLALEVAMVAYLVTGIFYHQFFVHWLWTILTLNVVLHAQVKRLLRVTQRSAARPRMMLRGSPAR